MSNGVTIQINSVAALERLLGDDAELAIDLRRSVAAEFARRHMESLVTEAVRAERAQSEAAIRKVIDAQLTEAKRTNDWRTEVNLTPQIKELIKARVEEVVRDTVVQQGMQLNKAIADEAAKMAARIPAMVADRCKKTFDTEVNTAVTQRLAEIRSLLPTGEETRKITVP